MRTRWCVSTRTRPGSATTPLRWYARGVRFFVALALLAGCDALWGLRRLDPAPDGPSDGALAPDAACQPQIIHDDFTGTKLCGNWGIPSGLAATEGGGMFVIAPQPNTGGSQGGCFAAAPVAFGDDGLFLEVTSVLAQQGDGQGGSYMFFTIHTPTPADAVTLQISLGGNHLSALTPDNATTGTVPYDPAQMKWWRLRPDRALPGVVADVSANGFVWQTLGQVAGTVPASVIVEFTAGTYGSGLPDPGKAILENFNVCPSP